MILAHRLASGPGPFGQNLTHPELNLIHAGFTQYYPGRLWKNRTESESEKLVAGQLCPARNQARWFRHTSLLPDSKHLAKTWPGLPDWIWVSSAQYDLCLLGKNGAEMDVRSQIRHILLARFWLAIMAIAGNNQNTPWLVPACLMG